MFEVEASVKTQETLEGQRLIEDFLRKCKNIQETVKSDEELVLEISKIKEKLINCDSKYVKSLLAA